MAPPAATLRAARERRTARERDEDEAQQRAHLPAVTRDGLVVEVAANVAAPGDIGAAVAAGADGVGLLRTEFLFRGKRSTARRGGAGDGPTGRWPRVSAAVRSWCARSMSAPTNSFPYLPSAHEDNPFLGLRGSASACVTTELLVGQLRAVLRVSVDHPVRLLLPMVATVDEVRRTRDLLEEARQSLAAAGVAVAERVALGIMVEVPAAALLADAFVAEVDFFSLGTNDLAQYVLAADRGNAAVAGLADALHPAVLRLMARLVDAAVAAGRPVAVCGEVAARPPGDPPAARPGDHASFRWPRPAYRRPSRPCGASRRPRPGGWPARALAAGSAEEVRRLLGSRVGRRPGREQVSSGEHEDSTGTVRLRRAARQSRQHGAGRGHPRPLPAARRGGRRAVRRARLRSSETVGEYFHTFRNADLLIEGFQTDPPAQLDLLRELRRPRRRCSGSSRSWCSDLLDSPLSADQFSLSLRAASDVVRGGPERAARRRLRRQPGAGRRVADRAAARPADGLPGARHAAAQTWSSRWPGGPRWPRSSSSSTGRCS